MGKILSILKDKEKMKHYITYFIVGVLTTLVSYLSFWLIREFLPIIEKNIANMISIILAIIFAYFANRIFVFKSTEKNMIKEFGKFALGRASSFVYETVSFWIFTTFLPIIPEMIVKVANSVIVMIINYVISRVFVFKYKDTKSKKEEASDN